MKPRELYIATLVLFTLLSCTKEVIYIEEEVTNTGNTYVRFTLDVNIIKTRGTDDHGSQEPTSDEQDIYNYGLFIFKSNGLLEATLISKSQSLSSPLIPDAEGKLTFSKNQNPDLTWSEDGNAIIISSGLKTFFAIVNAPKEYVDDQNSFINSKTFTLNDLKKMTLDLDRSLTKIVGKYSNGIVEFENPILPNGMNRGFMMTNIITNEQPDGFYTERLDETGEDEPPLSITISVGRAMAKVSLASDLTPVENITTKDVKQPNGALKVVSYKLINNPKEMNLALDMSNGVLTTPYFNNTTVNTANYFTSNNTSHNVEGYYIPVSTSSKQTFNYCIENANNTPKYGNTTIALIKGNFTPLADPRGEARIVDPSNFTDQPLPSNGDFYRIWIEPYTDNGASLGGEYAEEYFISEPSLTDLDNYIAVKGLSTTRDKLQVFYYPAGLCYYYLPLENDKNEGSPYSVFRNSYYQIDIESVSGPGYPDKSAEPGGPDKPGEPGGPDKPGPEIPIEVEAIIKASIKVDKWGEVNETGKL